MEINNLSINENNYRDIIILYCPEKVGSSSIVSSIRISASDKFMVFHTHENKIADIVNIKTNTINVSDIILNNTIINPFTNKYRQIYMIDIFRTPIERKISFFFQKISEIHFNNSEDNISNYPIDKIIKRFNDIYPYIQEIDYFNQHYQCENIEQFDFENKYIHKINNNVHYVKLRLQDSKYWSDILTKILGVKIYMIHNYDTENKNIGKKYLQFKNFYKLPYNYYKNIQDDKILNIYMKPEEKTKYIKKWFENISKPYEPFTLSEYNLYKKISDENKFYCANISNKHYSDDGCLCVKCSEERSNILSDLNNKIEKKNIYIRHLFNETYDNNIFLKLFPYDDKKISFDLIINLINT